MGGVVAAESSFVVVVSKGNGASREFRKGHVLRGSHGVVVVVLVLVEIGKAVVSEFVRLESREPGFALSVVGGGIPPDALKLQQGLESISVAVAVEAARVIVIDVDVQGGFPELSLSVRTDYRVICVLRTIPANGGRSFSVHFVIVVAAALLAAVSVVVVAPVVVVVFGGQRDPGKGRQDNFLPDHAVLSDKAAGFNHRIFPDNSVLCHDAAAELRTSPDHHPVHQVAVDELGSRFDDHALSQNTALQQASFSDCPAASHHSWAVDHRGPPDLGRVEDFFVLVVVTVVADGGRSTRRGR
mmetsp:Transcript_17929/g.49659  ORF Transcript_17929/g.49659 Transcript_17929/m.49659 type:complete len:299 (+) Transcript_17929:1010-1906(+)